VDPSQPTSSLETNQSFVAAKNVEGTSRESVSLLDEGLNFSCGAYVDSGNWLKPGLPGKTSEKNDRAIGSPPSTLEALLKYLSQAATEV